MRIPSPGSIAKGLLSTLLPATVITRGSRGTRRIAITFDDGPHPDNTPRLLDILDETGVPATFFFQGSTAEKHSHLVQAVFERGHVIGNHSFQHMDARKVATRDFVNDVLRAQRTLECIVGHELSRLFRPPYGSTTLRTLLALRSEGFQFVYWTVDSRDSYILDPGALIAQLASAPIAGGDVLLFHEDYARTIDAIRDIIGDLRQRGLTPTPLSELRPS
jgi:peptidoglycan/xylan/chitin deacetylase (PgdA/CDA1 family)